MPALRLFFALTILIPTFALAELKTVDCGYPNVRLEYEYPFDEDSGCQGIERAINFFNKLDLDTTGPLHLVFKHDVLFPLGDQIYPVYGMYTRAKHLVEMTSWANPWLQSPERTTFKLPNNKEFHISVVAHETTHALAQLNFKIKNPNSAVHEYLAYVTQLSTLDPELREKVLAKYPGKRFDVNLQINDFLHGADPHGFGVMSYRHYLSDEGGKKFIDDILTGRFDPISINDIQSVLPGVDIPFETQTTQAEQDQGVFVYPSE